MTGEIQLQASHPQENPNAFQERLTVTQSCKADCHYLKEKINGSPIATRQTFMTPAEILQFLEKMKIERIQESFPYAQVFLHEYIRQREKESKLRIILGPTIGDSTYFYRLGSIGTGDDMSREVLEQKKMLLTREGFPQFQSEEVNLINAINYFARAVNFPEKHFIIKHFPGGDPRLFATELESVHYSDPQQILGFLQSFREIITSRIQPRGVMVSHASYNLQAFPQIQTYLQQSPQNTLHPWLRNIDPSQIPASLNPIISGYLRNIFGFQGIIIPDWYSMGSIKRFLRDNEQYRQFYSFVPLRDRPHVPIEAMKVVLAVDAGMSFIPGIRHNSIQRFNWEAFEKANPQIFERFSRKLDGNLVHTFDCIKPQNSSIQFLPERFSLRQKLYLMMYDVDSVKYRPRSSYTSFLQGLFFNDADEYIQKVAQIFFNNAVGIDNDIWQRTGILVLIYRQKIIEHISGLKFANPPRPHRIEALQDEEEERWFQQLMNDPEFRQYYDLIDWNSELIRNLYKSTQHQIFSQYGK